MMLLCLPRCGKHGILERRPSLRAPEVTDEQFVREHHVDARKAGCGSDLARGLGMLSVEPIAAAENAGVASGHCEGQVGEQSSL
jgi:hypothetical protein